MPLKQENAVSIATLDSINVAHQNALEELKTTHAKNLDEAHDRAITAGHSAHALELEQLRASHADTITALKKEYAASQAAFVSDVEKYQASVTTETPMDDRIDEGLANTTRPKIQQNPPLIISPTGDIKRDCEVLQSMYAPDDRFVSEDPNDSAESSLVGDLENDANQQENALYYDLSAMKQIIVTLVGRNKISLMAKAILHTGMEFNWISSGILAKLGYDLDTLRRQAPGPATRSVTVYYGGFAGIPSRKVQFLVAFKGDWEVILGQELIDREFIMSEGILALPSGHVSKEMDIPNTPFIPDSGHGLKVPNLSNTHSPSIFTASNRDDVDQDIELYQETRHEAIKSNELLQTVKSLGITTLDRPHIFDSALSSSTYPTTYHGSPKYSDTLDISPPVGIDGNSDPALSGDPWYPLFPQDDQAEQSQAIQSSLLSDEVLEASQTLRKTNNDRKSKILTPPNSNTDLSISGVSSRKHDKPLPPIIVEDPNDTVAMKRARNTLAARKSRQRKMQRFDELEDQIAKLQAERDHWKGIANPGGPYFDGIQSSTHADDSSIHQAANEVNLSLNSNSHVKPPYSYTQMICQAILAVGDEKRTPQAIYDYITYNYAYYRNRSTNDSYDLKNSISHNLASNKAFLIANPSKKEWCLDPEFRDEMAKNCFLQVKSGGHLYVKPSDDNFGYENVKVSNKSNEEVEIRAVLDIGTKPNWITDSFLKSLGWQKKGNKNNRDNEETIDAKYHAHLLITSEHLLSSSTRLLKFLVSENSKFDLVIGSRTIFEEGLLGRPHALADKVLQQEISQGKSEHNVNSTQISAKIDKSDGDTAFSTSKDSGYGTTVSSIRPAASSIEKPTEDSAKWESQSIVSVQTLGTMQTMSSVNPAAAGGAAEEFAETLIRDESVYNLIVEGYQNFDPDRFERNFNRILERFAYGLKREAGNDLEKSAVRLVYNYRAYVIRLIRKRLALVQDEHATSLDELKTQQASKLALERFLEQLPGAERRLDHLVDYQQDNEDEAQEHDSSGSEISNDEQPHLRNLENVKLYLTSSRAYFELKQQLLAFVRPSNFGPVLEAEEKLHETPVDIDNRTSEIEAPDMVGAPETNRNEFDLQASQSFHMLQDSISSHEDLTNDHSFEDSLDPDGNKTGAGAGQGREILAMTKDLKLGPFLPGINNSALQGSGMLQSKLQNEPKELQIVEISESSDQTDNLDNITMCPKMSVLKQHKSTYRDSGTQTEFSAKFTPRSKPWDAFTSRSQSLSRRLIILRNWWARYTRKATKQGRTRIEWTCACGHDLYADFSTQSKEKLDQYSEILRSVPSGQSNAGSTHFAGGTLSIPLTAYLHSARSSSSAAASITNSQKNSTLTRRLPAASSMAPDTNPSFLELCVNTGAHLKTLGEIDLSDVSTDGALFQAVKNRYRELRGFRSRFWLLTPATVSFVRFSLENRHRVGILQKPLALPPKSEVDAKKWIYDPCPLEGDPPIAEDLFLHYLSCNEPSSTLFWMLRFPRKLETSLLTASGASTAFGWGIHIDEGPDYGAVFKANFVVLLVSGVAAWLWDYMKDDFQGAFGFACWIIAVLNSLLMAYMFKWRQE